MGGVLGVVAPPTTTTVLREPWTQDKDSSGRRRRARSKRSPNTRIRSHDPHSSHMTLTQVT